jgi:uncharacterized damage-inducible protein DinB
MTSAELSNLFRISHYAITVNLEGFTHEESLEQPLPGGNCLNWVLGHIVASRNLILKQLGEEPALHPAVAERYKRGSAPIAAPRDAAHLELLFKALQDSQERVLAGLARMTEAELAQPLENPITKNQTLGEALSFGHFHESYHAGQVALLRRLAGKQGQIK